MTAGNVAHRFDGVLLDVTVPGNDVEILATESREIRLRKADDAGVLSRRFAYQPFDAYQSVLQRRRNPGRCQSDDH